MSWLNRKSSKRKKQRFTAERLIFWCKRFGLFVASATFVIWLGAWFFLSGASTAFQQWAENKILLASVSMGFGIENVLVEGRHNTDRDLLLSLLNVEKGDALFGVPLRDAKEQIEKISWVKSVTLKRQLPDTLLVTLEERIPMALWQRDGKVSVIDEEGVVLTNRNMAQFKDFIIFTGKNVSRHAGAFMTLLVAEPTLHQKVEAAQYISDRRWNLKLKNGLLVQLPEEDMSFALSQLAAHQEKDGLLDKNIKALDLRMFPRIIVQTHPGAAYSYQANYSKTENAI